MLNLTLIWYTYVSTHVVFKCKLLFLQRQLVSECGRILLQFSLLNSMSNRLLDNRSLIVRTPSMSQYIDYIVNMYTVPLYLVHLGKDFSPFPFAI